MAIAGTKKSARNQHAGGGAAAASWGPQALATAVLHVIELLPKKVGHTWHVTHIHTCIHTCIHTQNSMPRSVNMPL